MTEGSAFSDPSLSNSFDLKKAWRATRVPGVEMGRTELVVGPVVER